MYRYCVDSAVTYTSEDFVLFRESPFACWMERLTLENPDHGIPPDAGSSAPGNFMERQDELGDTLRAEGKNVYTVDWEAEEPLRRNSTLEAMRGSVDFIVNGQLALGPLSGSANLLMRTSGYSELGNYLYIPCDTQAKTTMHSAFRLCFLADLLHSLQGQLPPQMLIIRSGSDLVPLQTEDHIYHYRAVKQRFMDAMRNFRKHRMPDPAESSHFGRWSDCANEVLKQRALRGEVLPDAPEAPDLSGANDTIEAPDDIDTSPMPRVALAAAPVIPEAVNAQSQQPGKFGSKGLEVSGTLADQAKMLHVGESFRPAEARPRISDSALHNLEFIGRGSVPMASPPPSAPEPPGSANFSGTVDRDEVEPAVVPAPVLNTDSTEFEVDCIDDSDYQLPAESPMDEPPRWQFVEESEKPPRVEAPVPSPLDASLHTSPVDQD